VDILLIAGHGDGDSGALNKPMGYREDDLTREVAYGVANYLKDYATINLYDTTKNLYKELKSGRESKNLFKSFDYVLEIHFNAFNTTAYGTECLVKQEKGVGVEQAILDGLVSLGFKSRGIKERADLQNMNMCRSVGTSYCLLEVCFIDNNSDLSLYLSKRGEVAKKVAEGVIKGFNLKGGVTIPTVFKDVPEGVFGASEINLLKGLGVINGYEDGTFRPNDSITRAEVAVMLGRLYRHLKT
jgi:N-acetylmuramoyl-L-alanine amidase